MLPIENYLTQACIDDFETAYSMFAIDCAFSMKSGEFNPMSGAFIQQIKRYFPVVVDAHGADAVKLAFTYKFMEEALGSKYTILSSVNSSITLNKESYVRENIQSICRSNMYISAKNMTYADKDSFGSMGFFIAIASINSNFTLKLKSLFKYEFNAYATEQGKLTTKVNLLRKGLEEDELFLKEDFVNLVLVNSILLKTPDTRYTHRDSSNGLDRQGHNIDVTFNSLLPALFVCSKRKYLSILNVMIASPRLYEYDLNVEDVNKCLISAGNELETFLSFMYNEGNEYFDLNAIKKLNNITVNHTSKDIDTIVDTEGGVDNFFISERNNITMALIVAGELCHPSSPSIVKSLPDMDDLDNDAIQHFNEKFSKYHEFLQEIHTPITEVNKQFTRFNLKKHIDHTFTIDLLIEKGFSLIPTRLCSKLANSFLFSQDEWIDIVINYNKHITKVTMELHKECIREIFTMNRSSLTTHIDTAYSIILNATRNYWMSDVYAEYLLTNGKTKIKNEFQPLGRFSDLYKISGNISFSAYNYIDTESERSEYGTSNLTIYSNLIPLASDYLDNSIDVLHDNNPRIVEFKDQLLSNFINLLFINGFTSLFSGMNSPLEKSVTVTDVSKAFTRLGSAIDEVLELYANTRTDDHTFNDTRSKKFINKLIEFLSDLEGYFDYEGMLEYIVDTEQNSEFVLPDTAPTEGFHWCTLDDVISKVTNSDTIEQENNSILTFYKLTYRLLHATINSLKSSSALIDATICKSITIKAQPVEESV